MSPSVIALLVIQGLGVLLAIVLVVQAFRTHAGWVVAPLLLLGPFVCGLVQFHSLAVGLLAIAGLIGTAVFALKHRQKAGILFLVYVGCSLASATLLFISPAVIAYYARINPKFPLLVKTVNPKAYEEAQQLTPSGEKLPPPPKPTPREVRDLAETETPEPTPRVDLNAAPRAAYAKHNKDLATSYQQLNAERGKLKPGSKAVAAFNAKAAKYQHDLSALADEKAKLDALDRATNLPVEAAAALVTMQGAAASSDYETFAATTKKALDDYRQTPSFPAITMLARATLAQVTADKVAAGTRDKAVRTARADFDKTTRQVQGIVNQTPAMVAAPPAGAEVTHYSYKAGANSPPPNYQAENLLATRELWKGQFAYMDEAPKVFYHSADCEFNPQLQSFYLNRNVPKKRLNDTEYQELTRLFRVLGQQEKTLATAAPPDGLANRVMADLSALKAQLDGYAMK